MHPGDGERTTVTGQVLLSAGGLSISPVPVAATLVILPADRGVGPRPPRWWRWTSSTSTAP
jgi:hypothetical protein